MYETLLPTTKAAQLLGISSERVRQLEKAGRLRGERTPLGRLFRRGDVEALAAERAAHTGTGKRGKSDAG